jgi:hypothetical protein
MPFPFIPIIQQTTLMQPSEDIENKEQDLTMHLFTVSAAMVGVCLTAIGLLRLIAAQTKIQTLGDDLLAINAVLFIFCVFIAFWSFKTKSPTTRQRLRWTVDALFLIALSFMGAICAMIAYAIF